jgi:small redox-active disulfide protein 2
MEAPVKPAVKRIEVLGPGCPRCLETYRVVTHAVEQAGLDCIVVKNEVIARMVELGVLRTPAVVLDGRVVHQGSIPNVEDVRRLLGQA